MSCPTCGRKIVAGECADGFMPYLSGDFPCPFNPAKDAAPRNLRVLPPLVVHHATPQPRPDVPSGKIEDVPGDPAPNYPEREAASSDGLEDLL